MRTQLLTFFFFFFCSGGLVWASGRALTPFQAAARPGQLVTVSGVVSGLGGLPDGIILRVGDAPSLPVIVPAAVRRAMRQDPAGLVGKSVTVTGFVSRGRAPVSLRVGQPGQLDRAIMRLSIHLGRRVRKTLQWKCIEVHAMRRKINVLIEIGRVACQ